MAEAFETRTSKPSSIDWEPQNALETAVGSKTSKNFRKLQMHPQPTSKPAIEWQKPSKPEPQKTSSIDWEPQNVLETAVGSKTSKNFRNPQMHQSLRGSTVTNYFKFSLAGTSTIVLYSPCANTFCVRGVASARPRRASKRFDCRLWKRDLFHQHNGKGKIVMMKTSRYKGLVFGFVFGTWNWYESWRRSWGLPCSRPAG